LSQTDDSTGAARILDRRAMLRGGATATALAGLGPLGLGLPLSPERRTRRVVLIAFAGGVRTRETFGAPDNVPNLRAMADEGVLYPRAQTANLGHFGASLSILTGVAEARGIRENARGTDPTLFEYLRKDLGLSAGDVWVSTSGGTQQTNYSHGLHPDYGARYGATALDGDGIFNREFKELLASHGRLRPRDAGEQRALGQLRAGLAGSNDEERESMERVESYILRELEGGTTAISGAGAGDLKAIRLAQGLLSVFKPRVLTIVLQNADIAHGSYNGYVEVIRRNDAAIGELWNIVKADPELAESTAFFVLPEFGRDADLNARRGLDHGDGSEDLRRVSLLAWGPDFRKGREASDEVRTIDVTPTICDLLGAEARHSRGRVLPGLYA